MATVLQLTEKRNNVWEQMKAIADRAAAGESLSAEDEAAWQKADADVVELDKLIRMQARLEDAPAGGPPASAGAPAHNTDPARVVGSEHLEVFERWFRNGPQALTPEENMRMQTRFQTVESRDQVSNIATLGGYLVPDEMMGSIEVATKAFGGMREAARVITTDGGGDLRWPSSDDTSNTGEILAETVAASEQNATFGRTVLKAYVFSSKIVQVSLQLMQDSAFSIEEFLNDTLLTRVLRAFNTYATVGAGANEPRGIVTSATSGVTAAATGAVTLDEIQNLEHAVDPSYRKNGRWMFHDNTLRDLKKIKDGEGRYIWVPGGPSGNGAPSTLWNYPYTINQDMPTMSTGNKSVLFGDFSKYIIRDVRGFSLVPFREKYMDQLLVGFLGYSRHDGGLIDAGMHPVQCITQA